MKIGIDIRLIGKDRTGDEVYFFNLVKNLSEIDHNNEYYLYIDRNPADNKKLAQELEKLNLADNFRIEFVNTPNRFLWNLWLLPAHLRKNKIDVFHTQYIAPFWLPKNIKLVLTIHDISFNFFPEYIKKLDLFFLERLIPRSIRRANKIIAVSESEKKNITDFYKILKEKVEFTYNGVDFERFSREYSDEKKDRIRKKYNLPENFLLYLGTLQPRKNIPILIDAIKNLDKKLVLAGNRDAHNFDQKIDGIIKKLNIKSKIIFPGWIEEGDKPILLKLADCFVFPSLYEGFGLPVLEAMAAGTPVVCSNIPVLREIGGDGVSLANPKNIAEFSENIQRITKDENFRQNLVIKGKNIAKKYNWHKTAEKTLEIYKSLS